MNISVTPEPEKFVNEEVRTGLYQSASVYELGPDARTRAPKKIPQPEGKQHSFVEGR